MNNDRPGSCSGVSFAHPSNVEPGEQPAASSVTAIRTAVLALIGRALSLACGERCAEHGTRRESVTTQRISAAVSGGNRVMHVLDIGVIGGHALASSCVR